MGKTVFIDVAWILLLQVIMLLMFAILIMGKTEVEENIPLQADFMITYSWDAEDSDYADIDGWAQRNLDPDTLCMFRRREVDAFILHNDNTGAEYGTIKGQRKKLKQATETITIHSKDENFYEFSLQGYRVGASVEPVDVTVTLWQTKPPKMIYNGTVEVYNGEETPVLAFDVDDKGNAVNVETKVGMLNELWRR